MPRRITYRQALREAFDEELARDENVCIIGEEVAQYNGAYKVTEGLWKKWGDKRIIDAPISEAGFIGMGIGASMLGVRPVMELMFYSFAYVAFDQMMNNAATCRYMSGGLINVPIVVRGPANGGTNVGATHSHTPENIFANMPGLKVVTPSDAYDAKGLIKSAIRDNDPVYFMESTVLYGMKGIVPSNDEIEGGELIVPIGKAKVKREGSDLTLIAHGRAVVTSLAAAEILGANPSMDANQQSQFKQVILSESRFLASRLERLSAHYRDIITGHWPMSDIYSGNLLQNLADRLREQHGIEATIIGLPHWLHGDSYSDAYAHALELDGERLAAVARDGVADTARLEVGERQVQQVSEQARTEFDVDAAGRMREDVAAQSREQ